MLATHIDEKLKHSNVQAKPALRTPPPARAMGDFGRWKGKLLAPALGLELQGISLAEAFSDGDIADIRQLLCKHKVLVFRDQDITPVQHLAFARRFGKLDVHPVVAHHPDHPELMTLIHDSNHLGIENVFHSDNSHYEEPALGSILRCVECPEVGGDTVFVNMAAAYEGLPDHVKAKIEHLGAMHDPVQVFGNRARTPELREELRKQLPTVEHPVVRTHPETGEKILFVNDHFTSHFANYRQVNEDVWNRDAPMQARELLILLLRQSRTPEYQLRVQWQKDTVVFWEDRSLQHYAISDYFPNARSMLRATVIGDRPR